MIFRAKPIAIEAWQWQGGEVERVPSWMVEATSRYPNPGGAVAYYEGDHTLRDSHPLHDAPHLAVVMADGQIVRMAQGAWLVRGPNGELSLIPAPVFAQMYEPAMVPATFTDDFAQSFDAMEWAFAFVERFARRPAVPMTVDLLHAWFANAMMRGWDEHAKRYPYRLTWRERINRWIEELRRKKVWRQSDAVTIDANKQPPR